MLDESDRQPAPVRAAMNAVWLGVIACGITGLQIGVPWLLCRLCAAPTALSQPWAFVDESPFWQRRLRFEEFFAPADSIGQILESLSSTICQEEFVVLLEIQHSFFRNCDATTLEVLRINLQTGKTSRTPAPPETRHVLSDGQTLWMLPNCESNLAPFLWNGRPTTVGGSYAQDSENQLVCFEDGSWRATNTYVLHPHCSTDLTCSSTARFAGLTIPRFDGEMIWFHAGLPLGNRTDSDRFYERHENDIDDFTDEELVETGWRRGNFGTYSHHISFGQSIAHRFDGNSLFTLSYIERDDQSLQQGFLQICFTDADLPRTKFIPSPIPWPNYDFVPFSMDSDVVSSSVNYADGTVYIVARNSSDGRTHVFRWDDEHLTLIAQEASPLGWLVCLDGGLYFLFGWAIPMSLLGGVAWRWERGSGPRQFTSGIKTARLASVTRRGAARLIDLMLVLTPLVLSVVCHPDFVGWWRAVTDDANVALNSFETALTRPNRWDWVTRGVGELHELLLHFLSAPRLWWLFLIGLGLLVLQIVWQGRTGQTIGKRFLGIRVVGSTLKPCGIFRSLLREIWLMLDSLLLFNWVPGIVSILCSRHSKRLGDQFSDTVVVREGV